MKRWAKTGALGLVALLGAGTLAGCSAEGSGNESTSATGGVDPATGGASSATGGGATAGTGGGSGGATGAGTGGQAATGGGTGSVDCASLTVCDGFESGTLDPAVWSKVLDYGGNGDEARVAIDATVGHESSSSVRVDGSSAVFGVSPTGGVDGAFYLRAWFKLPPLAEFGGNPVIIGVAEKNGDSTNYQKEVRLRLFENGGELLVAGNDAADSGLVPNATDGNGCPQCAVVGSEWFCAEMFVDPGNQSMDLWIDGQSAASVSATDGWSWPARADVVRFGVLALNGTGPVLHVDDVAIGSNRIGCSVN